MRVNLDQKISKGSTKPVDLICDYCGSTFVMEQRQYFKSHNIIAKDACKNCRSKKRQESCLKKYGTNVASKANEVRCKRTGGKLIEDYKEEILSLYQQDNMSVKQIADKIGVTRSVLITYMKSLGLDTTGDVVAKTKRTNKEKYGHDNFLQSNEGQKRSNASKIQKYGSVNPYDNPEYKEKILQKSIETTREKYGCDYIVQHPDRQEEFDRKRRETRIKNGNEVVYDGKSAKELAAAIGINLSSFHDRVRKVGLEKAVLTEKHQSYLEVMISQFLDENHIDYKEQYYVEGKIADFYIPSHNVVLEPSGNFWHSDCIIKDGSYHKNKRELYIKNNLVPLFFWEDEVTDKFDIVKSIILNKLGRSQRIYARNTIAVCGGTDKSFFVDNHLMGKGAGTIFSLLYHNSSVCSMQVRRLRDKDYEISRFCCQRGYSVVGGFSKLLSFVEHQLDMNSLRNFVDLRYGAGNHLEPLGFQKGEPSLSFCWTDGRNRWHRLKFRGNSGYKHGLFKIWDCGQLPFLKTY